MFPGYVSRLYKEMENLYKEKTLKIEPTKSDNGEKTLNIKPTKSGNGEKTLNIKPAKSGNGEKTLKIKPAESDNGEKTSKKNKVIKIIDSSRRKYSVFIGATVLAQIENSEKGDSGYWITKQDWEEVGPDIVLKKCQNIMA